MLHKEPRRADHARVVAQRRALDRQSLGKARHHAAQHALTKGLHQQLFLRAHAAADEYHFRIKDVYKARHARRDIVDPCAQHAKHDLIAPLRAIKDDASVELSLPRRFLCAPDKRRRRRIMLQTSALAARAGRAILIKREMPQLARNAARAAVQFAAKHYAA